MPGYDEIETMIESKCLDLLLFNDINNGYRCGKINTEEFIDLLETHIEEAQRLRTSLKQYLITIEYKGE